MKHLTILRHAKAEHLNDYPSDFARPLTSRGQKDAQLMAHLLLDIEPPVDWIVSSPAQRTRETTEALTAVLKFKRGIVWQEGIYEAQADTLLDLLSQVPAEMEHVLIVGHNPGLEELISGLVAGSTARLGITLPTAGLAHLSLELFGWNQIRWGCGTLHSLIRPKFVRSK